MNDTFHSNSSNYSNVTAISTGPLCAGLGLSCSRLYTARLIISYVATVGNSVIIPFMFYLTFAKVTDGFFKYFTLNLMINCITSAIAAFITDVINVVKLFVSIKENKLYLADIQDWARFHVRLGLTWFHALALYGVIICYLPYVKPLFYSRRFARKSQKSYYVVLHTSIILWGGSVTLLFKESISSIPYFLTHITLFIALFIAALLGSIKISRYKSTGVNATRVTKMQHRRLYSFIFYSYSIEISTLPTFINSCAYVFCIFTGCESNFLQSGFKRKLNLMIFYLYQMRAITVIAITILALQPYRRAVLSLLCRKMNAEVSSFTTHRK